MLRALPRNLRVVFSLTVGSLFAAEPTMDSLQTVKQNLESGKAVLIDVGELDEWNTGHLKQATHLPLSEIKKGLPVEQLAKHAPESKIVNLHCAAGVRYLSAAKQLKNTQWDLRPLKEGYTELLQNGVPRAEK